MAWKIVAEDRVEGGTAESGRDTVLSRVAPPSHPLYDLVSSMSARGDFEGPESCRRGPAWGLERFTLA